MTFSNQKTIDEYADKALSQKNGIDFDGDTNCTYRLTLALAYYGTAVGRGITDSGVALEVTIPRQVNNPLGMTISDETDDREEMIEFLESIIQKIKEAT